MPEADRFERCLPSQWRTPYRVAKVGRDDCALVVDELMPAFRETLALHSKADAFLEAFELLLEAVSASNGAQQSLINWTTHIARLDTSLEAIEQQHEGDLCIPVTARAVLAAYAQLKEDAGADIDREYVRNTLARKFGELMLRHQFLDRVRDGLMEARGRDLSRQLAWEADLLETLCPPLQAFFKTLMSLGRIPSRVPPRLTKRMEITRESLTQPLDIPGLRHE